MKFCIIFVCWERVIAQGRVFAAERAAIERAANLLNATPTNASNTTQAAVE